MLAPERLINRDATLTRTSTSGVDAYNNPVETTTTATVKCYVEQADRNESTTNTSQQSERWKIYLLPAAAPVKGTDRLTVGGITLEFTGPPWPAVNPRTGETSHIEAEGRRVA